MGLGHFNNTTGEFSLLVTFVNAVSSSDFSHWESIFKQTAQRFHTACRGKMRIKHFRISTNNHARHIADLVMHPQLNDKGYAYLKRFGLRGGDANVDIRNTTTLAGTIVHEFFHYIFGANDEYRTDWIRLEIDKEVDLDTLIQEAEFQPNLPANDDEAKKRIIPILPGQQIPNDHTSVKVRFDFDVENRIMFVVRDHYMTTNAPFTRIPQADATSPVYGYEGAGCTGECIMDDSGYNGSSGELVCDSTNHGGTNAQETTNAESCWETLVATMQELHNFDVNTAPAMAYADPTFEWLLPQRNIGIVFDRSGSMADIISTSTGDTKLQSAKEAAEMWLSTYAPGEFVSLTWYNGGHQTTQSLTEITTGSAANFASQLNVTATGWTNIRDALLEGLAQIQAGTEQAATKAVVLMTDGVHNRPIGSDAREAIPDFVAAHAQIYPVGFGAVDQVDMALLNDLARQTGGKSYWLGETALTEAIVLTSWELRGGTVQDWEGELGASGRDIRIRTPRVKKPKLKKLLGSHWLSDYTLLPSGRARRSDRIVIPAWIEAGSKMARFFVYRRTKKDDSLIYLLDSNDREINIDTLGPLYLKRENYELITIKKPKPGAWKVVLVRNATDTRSLQYRVMAGTENNNISVVGGASPMNSADAPVKIFAQASWHEVLTNLNVEAVISDQQGNKYVLDLHDSAVDLFKKGYYQGYFEPPHEGRYTGYIKISNHGYAVKALAGAHPSSEEVHKPKNKGYSIKSKAPRFTRIIHFYFDSGDMPRIKDRDRH